LFAILLSPCLVNAQDRSGPSDASKTVHQRDQRDYAPFPQPDAGYVTDIGHILTSAQEEGIERWLWQVESKTKVEIIVVIVNSIRDYGGTPNGSIEEFAKALFDRYGIGNLPRNDGVLLLVAVKDRQTRIELGAYYGRSRDDDAQRIVNRVIIPRFQKGDYAGGIMGGVRVIGAEFANVTIGTPWRLIAVLTGIPILGMIAFSLFRNGKRGWGWVCVGLIVVLILVAITVISVIVRNLPGRSWSPGGLGGFGGGFSGGGGATGGW